VTLYAAKAAGRDGWIVYTDALGSVMEPSLGLRATHHSPPNRTSLTVEAIGLTRLTG